MPQPDSLIKRDSIPPIAPPILSSNSSGLTAKVIYNSVDSMRFDIKSQMVYLYGDAHVDYESVKLSADYIEIGLKDNVLFAKGLPDSMGAIVGKPVFSDGGQSFTSETMHYNFKTKKGKITEAITHEDEGYIHGEKIKMVDDKVIFIKNGKYTTCDKPDPHFHIQATKLKIIKDDKIITGPAYLVVQDIPTPLAVPFGFFPNNEKQNSGILMPSYGEHTLGFYLQNGGYYLALNDNMDLSLMGSIYSRGSWGSEVMSNYKKRYKYNGLIDLTYNVNRLGDADLGTLEKTGSFFVRWKHIQDPKARPNGRFSADINAGSSNNFQNQLTTDATDYLKNTFISNISYARSVGIPWFTKRYGQSFNLSLSGNHNQNNNTQVVNVSLPEASFNLPRINPFKRKVKVGKDRFYEKIGISYSSNLKNSISAREEDLFTQNSINNMRNGFKHSIPVSTSMKLLKYVTINPSFNWNETFYLQSFEKSWDVINDSLVIDTIKGFSESHNFNLNATASTKLYGFYSFRKEGSPIVRHVMTPSVGFSYRPNYADERYGYYQTYNRNGEDVSYSIYDGTLYGGPGTGEQGTMTMSLMNNLELKMKSAKDTITGFKKVKIFDVLNISSSYNFLADEFQLAPVRLNARTKLFKMFDININNFTFDPYALDSAGVKHERFMINQVDETAIARITWAQASIGFRMKSKQGGKKRAATPGNEDQIDAINNNLDAYVDFTVPWSMSFNYNFRYTKPGQISTVTNTISVSGDISMTQNWKVGFRTGYDFIKNEFTYTSLDVFRDLHCWELHLRTVPFGNQKSYSIDLNVKSNILKDLKLSRKRTRFDF